MTGKEKAQTDSCSFSGTKPIMVDLPYPPIQVREPNQAYAHLLSVDYCGAVSELSAVTQYINNENRIAHSRCAVATTLLGLAMAEMMHLQKLGELIVLLGGNIDYAAKQGGGRRLWTPEYLTLPEHVARMLQADVAAEQAAIRQYEEHIRRMDDDCVCAVLERIIQDEEYHIMILNALLRREACG